MECLVCHDAIPRFTVIVKNPNLFLKTQLEQLRTESKIDTDKEVQIQSTETDVVTALRVKIQTLTAKCEELIQDNEFQTEKVCELKRQLKARYDQLIASAHDAEHQEEHVVELRKQLKDRCDQVDILSGDLLDREEHVVELRRLLDEQRQNMAIEDCLSDLPELIPMVSRKKVSSIIEKENKEEEDCEEDLPDLEEITCGEDSDDYSDFLYDDRVPHLVDENGNVVDDLEDDNTCCDDDESNDSWSETSSARETVEKEDEEVLDDVEGPLGLELDRVYSVKDDVSFTDNDFYEQCVSEVKAYFNAQTEYQRAEQSNKVDELSRLISQIRHPEACVNESESLVTQSSSSNIRNDYLQSYIEVSHPIVGTVDQKQQQQQHEDETLYKNYFRNTRKWKLDSYNMFCPDVVQAGVIDST
eukprot:gene27529-34261_t